MSALVPPIAATQRYSIMLFRVRSAQSTLYGASLYAVFEHPFFASCALQEASHDRSA